VKWIRDKAVEQQLMRGMVVFAVVLDERRSMDMELYAEVAVGVGMFEGDRVGVLVDGIEDGDRSLDMVQLF